MGLFSRALNLVGNLARNVAFIAAGALVDISHEAVQTIEAIKTEYRKYRHQNKNINLTQDNKAITVEVKVVNDEAFELEEKKIKDGRLNEYEQYQLNELYERRNTLRDRIGENREVIIAEEITNDSREYGNVLIQDSNSHVLQFHVGQAVFGKKCLCGKPMILQFARNQYSINMAGFFWSCIGYYDGTHKNIEKFTQYDMNLFTRIDRPEFQISTQQLGNILSLPGSSENVEKRMGKIKNHPTDIYLCPIHNEPMVLKEKRGAQGLLDQYFLGCPRWKAGNNGCTQVVKIKSPAQLASILEAFYGRGIL